MPQIICFHTDITVEKNPHYQEIEKQIADIQRLILLPMLKANAKN